MKFTGLALASGAVLAGGYQGITTAHDTLQQVDQMQVTIDDEHNYIRLVGERLETKIIEDQYQAVEQRQWELDRRYKGLANAPADTKEENRRLERQKAELKKKLDASAERAKGYGSAREFLK